MNSEQSKNVYAASQIRDGVLFLNGQPHFVWSADYPYYRDQSADWSKQLDNLKAMDVHVVTCYIPWRHHAPRDPRTGGSYDFTGQLNDRTNVIRFLQLVAERNMLAIVKPGPYIHAETRFGSLPDYVLPQNNPRISRRVDARGNPSPACWGFSEPPAPMDPLLVEYVADWFHAVARNVIVPFQYPHGPIIAVQVLNEGIYSDGGYAVDQLHYDPAAIKWYRQFLREKYGTLERYNEVTGNTYHSFDEIQPPHSWVSPQTRGALRPYLDWAEFHRYFYRILADTYIRFLRESGVELPIVMNINPPISARGAGLETFAGRYTPPYLEAVIHYGYTNWCGVVAHNEDAWLKYKMVGKFARGINMEENWGFDSYDPPYYWSVQPSFFQSMAYLLWGATGLNIYLGVSCDCWTDDLAPDAGGVYMHNHPIAENGSYRASFATCKQLGRLMQHVGDDLVRDPVVAPIAWGLYAPYAHAASWDSPPDDWQRLGFVQRPHAAWRAWDAFTALCERRYTPNDIAHIGDESVERLLRHKMIVFEGSRWMDAATQTRLVEYARRGGTLVITMERPDMDERFATCSILRDALFPCNVSAPHANGLFAVSTPEKDFVGSGRGPVSEIETGPFGQPLLRASLAQKSFVCAAVFQPPGFLGRGVFIGFSPWQTEAGEWGALGLVEHIAQKVAGIVPTATIRAQPADPRVTISEYPCASKHRRYFYVLTRHNRPREYHFETATSTAFARLFDLTLPAFSGAFVGLEEKDRIVAAFIKGYNDLDKSEASPLLITASGVVAAEAPCDLYFCKTGAHQWEFSVANVRTQDHRVAVRLPIPFSTRLRVERVFSDGRVEMIHFESASGGLRVVAEDMQPAHDRAWSPYYRAVEQ